MLQIFTMDIIWSLLNVCYRNRSRFCYSRIKKLCDALKQLRGLYGGLNIFIYVDNVYVWIQGPRRYGLQVVGLYPPRKGEQIVSIPALEMGAGFLVYLGRPTMRARWMTGTVAHKSGICPVKSRTDEHSVASRFVDLSRWSGILTGYLSGPYGLSPIDRRSRTPPMLKGGSGCMDPFIL